VVSFALKELGSFLVGLSLLLLGPVPDVLHRQHRHNGQNLKKTKTE